MRAGTHRILPVAALVVAIAALTVALIRGVGFITLDRTPAYFAIEGVCWTLFAAAVLLLLRVPRRAAPAVVLLGTVLLGAAGASGPPNISTDSARYNWDGIVQDAGVSPYRFVPADAALAPLRPAWLFPAGATAADGTLTCPGPLKLPVEQIGAAGTVCTAINRPTVPTIYPPVAEALFAAARIAVPADAQYLPTQLLGLLAVLGTTALLLRTLRSAGRDPRLAAVFGWCPFVVTEAVTNAHIDAWAALLALAATVLISRGRQGWGGVVLGLAIATKFLPVLVVPPLGRRRPWLIGLTAIGTVALVYVPHVLAVGPSVIGYLPGYLNEEGYDSGSRSALLSAVLPDAASTPAALILLAVLAVVLLIRSDPADPWAAQTVMVGSALLILSPAYGWYSLLLVPFIVMSGRWEWFAVVIGLSLIGVHHDLPIMRSVLVVVLAMVVLSALLRRRLRSPDLGAA
ncbi:glycosyltransferase 87 family protein [uncultured Amnibacterium sp.]|uniref:glycosyltransferase 87 family protein n=1 Tax=uncultured Amnibacterium sp. TaxID=1631851 RepID=UPI0035CC218C